MAISLQKGGKRSHRKGSKKGSKKRSHRKGGNPFLATVSELLLPTGLTAGVTAAGLGLAAHASKRRSHKGGRRSNRRRSPAVGGKRHSNRKGSKRH